ncbi:MAG: hypothetical protein ACOYT9_01830 [Patescibacteria group bacterium]
MESKSLLPFLLPAAIVVAAILIGGALYLNKTQPVSPYMNATVTPTPSVIISETPLVSATPTISVEDLLRTLVLEKSGIPEEKFEFSVGTLEENIAKGSVKNSDDIGGAAWFAGKVDNAWQVSYIGQGVPLCSDLGDIPYPTSWLSHCMSQGNTVQR